MTQREIMANEVLLDALSAEPAAGGTPRKGKDRNASARRKRVVVRVLQYILLTAIALFLVFPFALMVSQSVMSQEQSIRGDLIPTRIVWEGYRELFAHEDYLSSLWRTLYIVVFNVFAVPLSASLCAYSCARTRWKGKEFVFAAMLATLMIPGVVTQVPLYQLFAQMHWTNTILPLTIPNLFGGGAVNIFLFRQFMRSIPYELEEAAKIDGANAFKRYALITLPLCVPILLFVAVGAFGSSWGDYFQPMFYFTDPHKFTLAYTVYKIVVLDGVKFNSVAMAAGVFMAILPALVFFLLQRKLIDGIMVGAVKG